MHKKHVLYTKGSFKNNKLFTDSGCMEEWGYFDFGVFQGFFFKQIYSLLIIVGFAIPSLFLCCINNGCFYYYSSSSDHVLFFLRLVELTFLSVSWFISLLVWKTNNKDLLI